MSENPLLPHAQLRVLRRFLKKTGELLANGTPAREQRGRVASAALAAMPGAEALLAATLLQMEAGDVVVTGESVDRLSSLLRSRRDTTAGMPSVQRFGPDSQQLLMGAGMAAALQRAGEERMVLAFVHAGAKETGWENAFRWAQETLLPLVVVYADPSGDDAFLPALEPTDPGAMGWAAVTKVTRRVQLPVLTMDGQDAVAVYRVMQESVLRARAGGGPALLWAVLPQKPNSRRKRDVEVTALQRLDRFMDVRKISIRGR